MKVRGCLLACLTLAGCASWGGNVRGDFACTAPQGTCAPTAEIDARAVERATRGGTAMLVVSGGAARTVQGEAMARTDERVLRIVFYPHIDEQGHFHEKAAVRAVVAGSGWRDGADAGRAQGSRAAQPRASALEGEAVPQAPEPSAPQTLVEEGVDEPR